MLFKLTPPYCIKDLKTEEVVVPYDSDFTRMSCDSDGMFTNVWFQGLYPERLYKFELEVVSDNDDFHYSYDIDQPFKIVK